MAVALDAKMAAGNSSDGFNQEATAATSISSTGITVGGSASLLLAFFSWGAGVGGTPPSSPAATWNAGGMTAGPTVTHSAGGAFSMVAIFYKISPAFGANTLAGSWGNANDCYMSAASFTGTDTSTGINVSDSTTATGVTTLTITSDANGATLAVFAVNGSTPTVNFNKIFAEAPLNPGGGASYQLGGSSNGHTFTGAGGTVQALAGVHIIAAGAGGGATINDHNFRSVGRGAGSGVVRGVASPRYLMQRRNRLFVPVGIDLRGVPLRQAA